jgi:hypothetical protein
MFLLGFFAGFDPRNEGLRFARNVYIDIIIFWKDIYSSAIRLVSEKTPRTDIQRKAPNPNLQTPGKLQNPNSKPPPP